MVDIIKNLYLVGPHQEFETANQAMLEIAAALGGGDFELPSADLPDGGQVNVVFVGGGLHPPLKIPNDTTGPLHDNARTLVIKADTEQTLGLPGENTVPIISINAPSTSELVTSDKLIGLDVGSNNPSVVIRSIRVEGFVMGIRVGPNCHNFSLDRSFITNNLNAQVFIRDLDKAYITNNVIVGGEYGLVCKFVKRARIYHNTIFLDGVSTLGDSGAKTGMILQGERLFGVSAHKNLYSLGNLVFTIGCPAVVYYDEDLKNNRLYSNFNDFFAVGQPIVQLRQDSATMTDEEEVVLHDFFDLFSWRSEGQLGDLVDEFDHPKGVDSDSISVHPVFISNIQNSSYGNISILDLTTINNSPILQKVPAWYNVNDDDYIPVDFDSTLIATDSLLNNRETPDTSVGANDAPSANGFFGTDIFTSPLVNDIDKICDVDPLIGLTKQNIEMAYPSILAGYFYSNERPYYLYAKKGAYQLGFLARSTFTLPGFIDASKEITVTARGQEVPEDDWDIIGQEFVIYHKSHGAIHDNDEVTVECWIKEWFDSAGTYGFTFKKAYYAFKVKDSKVEYVMPDNFVSNAPIVVTDDRVSYRDPAAICRTNFSVDFDKERQESRLEFLGNENLFENPQFNVSTNGRHPQGWLSNADESVFMVSTDYSYIGEQAVALATFTGVSKEAGKIVSNRIYIASGEPMSMSWHATVPHGITTGGTHTTDGIDALTGQYSVSFYSNQGSGVSTVTGDFLPTIDGYKRFYINFGPDESVIPDNVIDPDDIGFSGLNDILYDIPHSAEYAELTISAKLNQAISGAILIDACQAEKDILPSVYHQSPSHEHMTVEFETDDSGIFVDKRMNLSPYFNQNPNGFLYIADIPAKVWGGPEDLEVTSLHEYRWPEGRLYHLPWSRLHGKDKMSYMAHDATEPHEPYGIIEPFSMPKRANESYMVPNALLTVQSDLLPEGISLNVLDNIGNPFSLRNYTATAYDPNGNFPGYLSKTKFGAKEQLGATVFGQLNENGAANIFYVPPPREVVSYVDLVPSTMVSQTGDTTEHDTVSYITTKYNVNLENNGNITVIGRSGEFHNTAADDLLTGSYYVTNDTAPYVSLQYPPVFGSVSAIYSGTTFIETIEVTQNSQFTVDYTNAQILFSPDIDRTAPVDIRYIPKYAYPAPEQPNKIVFHHEKVFGTYTGPIQVDYDAELFVEIAAQQPVSGEHSNSFIIVAQNPQLSVVTNNTLSLEF
jgi:hypothetical protein